MRWLAPGFVAHWVVERYSVVKAGLAAERVFGRHAEAGSLAIAGPRARIFDLALLLALAIAIDSAAPVR